MVPDPPVLHPPPLVLADVEMLAVGAFGARVGFTGPLAMPDVLHAAAQPHGSVVVVDAEGVPVAEVSTDGRVGARPRHRSDHMAALLRGPSDVPSGPWAAVLVDRPLTRGEIARLAALDEPVLVIARTVGCRVPVAVLLRSVLAASRQLPGSTVVALPFAPSTDPELEGARRALVLAAYGATETHVLDEDGWSEVEAALRLGDQARLSAAVDAGTLSVLLDWRPPPDHRGLVVFFTGLSGSGKSTVAAGVASRLEDAGRRVTLLDGDVARRALSPDLGFSPQERDQNIRRLGWVAAEVARHRGVAVLAPIAPYARTRAEVREMVEAVGDLVLVWVATPLAECERRDRKGLYARARAGLVPDFTGVSAPYEQPTDADLVLDTTGRTPAQAVEVVVAHLQAGGWITEAGAGAATE